MWFHVRFRGKMGFGLRFDTRVFLIRFIVPPQLCFLPSRDVRARDAAFGGFGHGVLM